ncbi:MAG TPA: HAMP domain-containing sensor histidine kinase [Gammaproteobacteria bacterium]|nr:HAMP domain-containing sensor histidine kinase [Gammaproteobacteria bacterium]
MTLYSKFALTIFILFSGLGALLITMHFYSTYMYQQESQQKLHRNLAAHIVKSYAIIKNGILNKDKLDHLFHNLMEVNPAIEIYALDATGKILAFNAPAEKVVRDRIDLKPVLSFIDRKKTLPVEGEDPRSKQNSKIFSAAPLIDKGKLVGYLYVILEGERYKNVFSHLMDSYVFKMSFRVIVVAVVVAMFVAMLVFSVMTRRLKTLANNMQEFRQADFSVLPENSMAIPEHGDELDRLAQSFNEMTERMMQQLSKLKQSDIHRREIVANVSHDLRTPLTTLQGYLETLLRKSSELDDTEKERYLNTALKHSQSLSRLVSELFELAQLDANEQIIRLEPFSLQELVHDVIQKYWLPASERDISVVANFENDLPFVKADIALIERVLDNLIENAIRYTPGNGKIVIALSYSGNRLLVQVRDNGCGIAEKELPMIFERFYRPEKSRDSQSGGAGLGLAITKKILELHGSYIKADSKPGQGAVFKFYLPVA